MRFKQKSQECSQSQRFLGVTLLSALLLSGVGSFSAHAIESQMHYRVESLQGQGRMSYAQIDYQGESIVAVSDPFYNAQRGVMRLYRQQNDGSLFLLGEKHGWSGYLFLGMRLSFVINQGRLYLNYNAPGDGGSGALYVDEILISGNQATFEWTGLGILSFRTSQSNASSGTGSQASGITSSSTIDGGDGSLNTLNSSTGGSGGDPSRPFDTIAAGFEILKDSSGRLFYVLSNPLNSEVAMYRIELDGTRSAATQICTVSDFGNPRFGKSLVSTSFDDINASVIIASDTRVMGFELSVTGFCIEKARINRTPGKIIRQLRAIDSFGSSVPLVAFSEIEDQNFSDQVTIRFFNEADQLEGIYNDYRSFTVDAPFNASSFLYTFFFIDGQDHSWGTDPVMALGIPGDSFHGNHMSFYDPQGTEIHRTTLGPINGSTPEAAHGLGTGLIPIQREGHPNQKALFVSHGQGAVITSLGPGLKKMAQTVQGAEAPEMVLEAPFRIGNSVRLKVKMQNTQILTAFGILTIEGVGQVTQFPIPNTNFSVEMNASTQSLGQYFPTQNMQEVEMSFPIPNDPNLKGLPFSVDFVVIDGNGEFSVVGERYVITQ